jgi:methyl-accepting chemotaxis protein
MSAHSADDLRTILHALADRLAEAVSTASRESVRPPTQAPIAQRELDADAMRAALEGIASGNLTYRAPNAASPATAQVVNDALDRVRTLVRAAHESSGGVGTRADNIVEAVERAANAGNHQRLSLDRTADELRPLSSRLDDLAQETSELATIGDRIALLALNTGIEGLRVGGEVARALGGLGDEIRRLALRTAMSAREIGEALRGSAELSQRATMGLEDARTALRSIADEVTRAAASAESVRVSDDSLRDAARMFRVLDVESEALVERLEEAASRIAPDVARARELAAVDGTASEDVQAALARLAHAVRGGA